MPSPWFWDIIPPYSLLSYTSSFFVSQVRFFFLWKAWLGVSPCANICIIFYFNTVCIFLFSTYHIILLLCFSSCYETVSYMRAGAMSVFLIVVYLAPRNYSLSGTIQIFWMIELINTSLLRIFSLATSEKNYSSLFSCSWSFSPCLVFIFIFSSIHSCNKMLLWTF
jgi:hypothetical protein